MEQTSLKGDEGIRQGISPTALITGFLGSHKNPSLTLTAPSLL